MKKKGVVDDEHDPGTRRVTSTVRKGVSRVRKEGLYFFKVLYGTKYFFCFCILMEVLLHKTIFKRNRYSLII